MEITESEKIKLENSDLSWERPSQTFINQWNIACGDYGGYNENTGFFELNGLTDITYEEAIQIYNAGKISGFYGQETYTRNHDIRTNIPATGSYSWAVMTNAFIQCDKLEVANMQYARIGNSTFTYCKKLKRIVGQCQTSQYAGNCFFQCYALEDIEDLTIKNNVDIDFHYCPLLNFQSFERIISKSQNTQPITFTVHPDVYAKLTGDTTNENYNNLTDGEKTQWTSLVETASEKNIQFITT